MVPGRWRGWRRTAPLGLATLTLALLPASLAGCGDEEKAGQSEPGQPPSVTQPADLEADPPDRDDGAEASGEPSRSSEPEGEGGSTDPAEARRRAATRRAERLYRDYINALNSLDGARVCELLAPGSWRRLRPPERRSGCADSIGESIGYRDRRGYPVWEETVLSGFEQLETDRGGDSVRVTASVVTRFADRSQPSVESDVAYFERTADGWRLAKPSGVLYRAVGKPEYPASVLSPP